MKLTKEQIQQQDFVDSTIGQMISNLIEPFGIVYKHDIEICAEIRDLITKHYNLSEQFYPFIAEDF